MSHYPTIGGQNCLDPGVLYEHATAEGLPLNFWGRANSYSCPLGSAAGVAWFLLLRRQLDKIAQESFVSATFRSARGDITIPKLLFVRATCIAKGPEDRDPNAPYLAQYLDKRHVLRMSTVGAASSPAGSGQYNVRYPWPPGATGVDKYFSESLNAGSLWTWQTLLNNLWAMLPSGAAPGTAPTLPYTPDGTPEGFRFQGVSVWDAIETVLAKINCAVRYNPIADSFSYVRLGETQSSLEETIDGLTNRLLEDHEPIEGNAAEIPETIRVFFHRINEQYGINPDGPRTGNCDMAPVYTVDRPSNVSFAMAGTVLPLWDDLAAEYDRSGALVNGADLTARATQVAQNYVNRMTITDRISRRKYSGIVSTILPGSEISEVIWRDYGDGWGVVTEITNRRAGDGGGVSSLGGCYPPSNFRPGLAEWLLPPDLGRATHETHSRRLIGRLDGALAQGGSATVSIWRWDGAAYVDTTVNVTAYDWLLAVGDADLPTDTDVAIEYFPDSDRWFVVGTKGSAGTTLKLGILAGDLEYRRRANVNIYKPVDGTSSTASYVATGEVLSAGDWMLNTGEDLAGGTHVVIAQFPAVTGNSWVVIAAACAADPNDAPSPALFAQAMQQIPRGMMRGRTSNLSTITMPLG